MCEYVCTIMRVNFGIGTDAAAATAFFCTSVVHFLSCIFVNATGKDKKISAKEQSAPERNACQAKCSINFDLIGVWPLIGEHFRSSDMIF